MYSGKIFMFYVYILKSLTTEKYYVGQTQNLEERIIRHNTNQSNFTKNKGPWELVYFKQYPTRAEAMNEEARIKSMKSRKYIENLIKYHG